MVKEIKQEEFDNIIKDEKVVIDCYANWCGPCQALSPIIDEISEELTNIKFYKLDVDQAEELTYQFRIMSIPTILIFEQGELKQTLVGFKNKEELLQILK